MEISNEINNDYIYYGHVNNNGTVIIFNQDGEEQLVKYTDVSVTPHRKYKYNSNVLTVIDENGEETEVEVKDTDEVIGYFEHDPTEPLKYCISKNHIIFTNPARVPTLDGRTEATDAEKNKYYSFVNLKVFDPENYNYVFKVFTEGTDTYTYIKDIKLDSVEDVLGDYDQDLTLPLQTQGPFQFTETPQGGGEPAIFEVTFVGQIVQLKSSDGDGFRNEARYTWSTKLITPGKGFKKGEVYRETLAGVNGNPDLKLTFKINDVNTVTATENVDISPADLSNADLDSLLADLASKFKNVGGIDKAVVVGSGIYLEDSEPFSVSTAEIAVADVINSQKLDTNEVLDYVPIARVNTVAELPVECYAGFIVEVLNSFDNQNNYFLEYKAESQSSDLDLTKSDGYWEEVKKPFEVYNPENTTLPHMITVARESDQDKFTFVVSPIEYKLRSAGTAKNNPSMFEDQARITEINYYKNRLFFMTSVGTVVTSRAGEIDNLFLNTAVSTSLIDPIDLVANSNQRVPIHGSAVVNNGLVMFGDTEQYSMTTANDVLTSETASLTKISNYTFDSMSDPIYLGTNLGFISSGLTRFYEMTNVYDRGPVDINERSQQIFSQFGQGFNMPASSREQAQVSVYKRYTDRGSRAMYIYRFRQENSQTSSQTSWVRWEVDEPITYVSMPNDKMFVMLESGKLYRMDSTSISGLPVSGVSIVPNFTDGYTDDADGVEFESRIKFPTIYPRNKELYDITANTTIHRIKISTAAVGAYNLTIDRQGYDSYELLVEQTPSDEYRGNFPQLRGEHIETVPVYTRNHNLDITISTKFPAPMILRSMTWEGDWNPPYYRRV